MDTLEPSLETVQTFLSGSFNGTSVVKLQTCFAGEVATVADLANGALDATIQATQSAPWQAFSAATLAFAMALLFLGFYLVRIVNFVGGFYLGSSLSLFLITLFAADLPMVRAARLLPAGCARAAPLHTARRAHAASLCARNRRSHRSTIRRIFSDI